MQSILEELFFERVRKIEGSKRIEELEKDIEDNKKRLKNTHEQEK